MTNKSLFLLYVSVMLVITFLRQEFVLLPELQNLDLLSEESNVQMMEKWKEWRWISFVASPLILLLRLSLVSLCMYIGGFFFSELSGIKFKDWWEVAMVAQLVLIIYSIAIVIVNIIAGSDGALSITKYTSLLFIGGDDIEPWIRLPLSVVNLFEIAYWCALSKLVSIKSGLRFSKSFKFVMSTYAFGYLFYIVLLMFLILYFN